MYIIWWLYYKKRAGKTCTVALLIAPMVETEAAIDYGKDKSNGDD